MKLSDFQLGDCLIFTQRSSRGEELRSAEVSMIDYNGNGLVTYVGVGGFGCQESGTGAFDPELVGTKPLGFYCAVEIIRNGAKRKPVAAAPVVAAPKPVVAAPVVAAFAHKRLTTKIVNAALADAGLDAEIVYAREGYFYFAGKSVEGAKSTSVMAPKLNCLTLTEWVEEALNIAASID